MKILSQTVGAIGTNCYLLCDEKAGVAAMIDPGAEPEKILSLLEKSGCRAQMILLTHGHFDHIGAAAAVRAATHAPLFAAAPEKDLLQSAAKNLSVSIGGSACTLSPDRLLADGEEIALGSLRLTTLFTPGHTAGCCCFIGEGFIFSGDTLFAGACGRTDLPTSSPAAMQASLRRLFALEGEYTVYPGHGGATTLSAERGGDFSL